MNQQNIDQQKKKQRAKGIADVVFCIDKSGSMTDVIEGLKDNIETFIDGLKKNQLISTLDLRLGILAHDEEEFWKLDFTKNINEFKSALRKIETGYDEFTLPGLDWSLDFDWRKSTHIIVAFTDEPLAGGHKPDLQRSKMDELMKKFAKLKVNLFFVGTECPEYEKLIEITPRTTGKLIGAGDREIFSSYKFADLLKAIGKTLSASLNNQDGVSSVKKDIYNIKSSIKLEPLK